MGQYYYAVILDANGWIRAWMAPGFGVKLMEHSYLDNEGVGAFEWELTPEGRHHMSRVVWCGDYADAEPGLGKNLHLICNERKDLMLAPNAVTLGEHLFLVNHTKRQFVDKSKVPKGLDGLRIHPLPLLTCEGNGRGGGDFCDESPLIGSWARDVISAEKTAPDGFTELAFDLVVEY
uniref:Uncharacterized protein n=1 Tax=viral metagenome TaxID=1070528 RepID=A0A6C0LPE2_9ZZZZ